MYISVINTPPKFKGYAGQAAQQIITYKPMNPLSDFVISEFVFSIFPCGSIQFAARVPNKAKSKKLFQVLAAAGFSESSVRNSLGGAAVRSKDRAVLSIFLRAITRAEPAFTAEAQNIASSYKLDLTSTYTLPVWLKDEYSSVDLTPYSVIFMKTQVSDTNTIVHFESLQCNDGHYKFSVHASDDAGTERILCAMAAAGFPRNQIHRNLLNYLSFKSKHPALLSNFLRVLIHVDPEFEVIAKDVATLHNLDISVHYVPEHPDDARLALESIFLIMQSLPTQDDDSLNGFEPNPHFFTFDDDHTSNNSPEHSGIDHQLLLALWQLSMLGLPTFETDPTPELIKINESQPTPNERYIESIFIPKFYTQKDDTARRIITYTLQEPTSELVFTEFSISEFPQGKLQFNIELTDTENSRKFKKYLTEAGFSIFISRCPNSFLVCSKDKTVLSIVLQTVARAEREFASTAERIAKKYGLDMNGTYTLPKWYKEEIVTPPKSNTPWSLTARYDNTKVSEVSIVSAVIAREHDDKVFDVSIKAHNPVAFALLKHKFVAAGFSEHQIIDESYMDLSVKSHRPQIISEFLKIVMSVDPEFEEAACEVAKQFNLNDFKSSTSESNDNDDFPDDNDNSPRP